LWSGKSLDNLAQEINPTVRGWINFHGRFYRSELVSLLENINEHLARWATRKFKRLRGRPGRARRLLAVIAAREPDLFAHWVCGARPLAG
jgi:RNA-directed DNA polymerase